MPYITQEKRDEIDPGIDLLITWLDGVRLGGGTLNYIFSRIITYVWKRNRSYDTINTLKGAISCAWDEFDRRIVSNYEYKQQNTNGDIEGYIGE